MSRDPHEKGCVAALLLCSERSGSNLLRCMLDAHPRVFAPNTMALGHLCADYEENPHKRGDPEYWWSLQREVCRRINLSTFYTDVHVDERELAEAVLYGDVAALYLYAYVKGMQQSGADRIVIKEHQAWRLAPSFLRWFPEAKIIVQVRDPRDHAVSCKKLGYRYTAYHGSVERAAQMWSRDQRGALMVRDEYGENRVRIHRYEDLVLRSRDTLERICNFLELGWEEPMLEYHSLQASQKQRSKTYLSNMWANLDQPVTARSVGQWREKLTPVEQRVVEEETGQLLPLFGYDATPETAKIANLLYRGYRLCAAARYLTVTWGIFLTWLIVKRDFRVPLDVILGNAIRAHLAYERFRDRIGYRL